MTMFIIVGKLRVYELGSTGARDRESEGIEYMYEWQGQNRVTERE